MTSSADGIISESQECHYGIISECQECHYGIISEARSVTIVLTMEGLFES